MRRVEILVGMQVTPGGLAQGLGRREAGWWLGVHTEQRRLQATGAPRQQRRLHGRSSPRTRCLRCGVAGGGEACARAPSRQRRGLLLSRVPLHALCMGPASHAVWAFLEGAVTASKAQRPLLMHSPVCSTSGGWCCWVGVLACESTGALACLFEFSCCLSCRGAVARWLQPHLSQTSVCV